MDTLGAFLGMDLGALAMGAGLALAAAALGYHMRGRGHAIMPFRDPVLIAILASQIAVVVIAAIFPTDPFLIRITGDVPVFLALGFDGGYILGYLMCRPNDTIYVDLPTEDVGSNIIPLVHYIHDGQMYMMPQNLKMVLAGLIGVRCPLDARLYDVSQVREIYATNGLIAVRVQAAAACLHEHEPIIVDKCRIGTRKIRAGGWRSPVTATEPRYLFHFRAERHRIRFSYSTISDPLTFWREKEIYLETIAVAAEAREYATRLEVQLPAASYDAASDLIAGMIRLTTDAPTFEDDLRAAIADERERRDRRPRREDNDGRTE